ncbi:MAG: AAA family ATPase [Pirellulales bacterium]|nr:AAA family ATPase [Pirellulales bacterium]
MRITDLKIDGFGVWRGLQLDDLSDRISVLYGPNEAGKTTLLQFIRGMLYGFGDERRRRYLGQQNGAPAGGSLHLSDPTGDVRLRRLAQPDEAGVYTERLDLRADDGRRLADGAVGTLLGKIDERTFNNVFAVGLREMQELGTLSDTDAARHLYRITAGLDRISLFDVMRELANSRNRILATDERPSQVVHLLGERERLRREIDELGTLSADYERNLRERDGLAREIDRLETETRSLEREVRRIETAVKVEGRWRERATLDARLAALEPLPKLPERALERLAALDAAIAARRQRQNELRAEVLRKDEAIADLPLQESVWKQGARIQALGDQIEWAETLETQIAALTTEVEQLSAEVNGHHEHLGLADGDDPDSNSWSDRTLLTLRPLARSLAETKRRLKTAEAAVAKLKSAGTNSDVELRNALRGRTEADLTAAHAKAGSLVSLLRRRVQLDERIGQLHEQHRAASARHRRLLERQMMPGWVLTGLGCVFAFGVALILSGLFMPTTITGPLGWWLATLGLGGSIVAGITKLSLERSVRHQLESCDQLHHSLELQVKQAKEERDTLDGQLPQGSGPLITRLQESERELAAIEDLLPLEARRRASTSELKTAEEQVEKCREAHRAARRRWQNGLATAGLPHDFSPRRLRELGNRRELIVDVRQRLTLRRQELDMQRRSLARMGERISLLTAEAGLPPTSGKAVELIRRLQNEYARQERLMAERDQLTELVTQLRAELAHTSRAGKRLTKKRLAFLRSIDARDADELRHWVDLVEQAARLREARAAVEREITTALGDEHREETWRALLDGKSLPELERLWDELAADVGRRETQLKSLYERRGELTAQIAALAADRRPAEKRLQYSIVGRRLKDALRRWKVLATTHHLLEGVRRIYETERQPETLREASVYMSELTRGRYKRIWTPLGEHVLHVDTADGRSLPVEALSRGTREQLFLSLRLALCSAYARRGVHLPLVLDDILVNFDADRAKAAAAVLRDFALAGHQLLIFTCHEHIAKLFRALKVDVRRLPDHADIDMIARPIEEPAPEPVAAPAPAAIPAPAPVPAPVPKRRPVAALRKPARPEPEIVVEPAPLPVATPAFFEEDVDAYDWEPVAPPAPVVESPAPYAMEPIVEAPKVVEPAPLVVEVEAVAAPMPEPVEYVEVRGRTLWSGEGAEDFAGEFAERIVDRFTRYGWGGAEIDDASSDAASEPAVRSRSKVATVKDLDDLLDLDEEAEAA